MNKSVIVIPARLESTRLPRKLLRRVNGKSILQYTYEAASKSQQASEIVVAVDSPELRDEVESFGGRAIMTSVDCESGTDRIAEVAANMSDADVFVNVQGDEPEIDALEIDRVITILNQNPAAAAATMATPIRSAELFEDPNCVKVALESKTDSPSAGYALYFSRSPIPFPRDGNVAALASKNPPQCWQHIGIYAYRRHTLEWFSQQPSGQLEQIEKLEQLRMLENGNRIVVGHTNSHAIGIDTQDDLERFENKIQESQ